MKTKLDRTDLEDLVAKVYYHRIPDTTTTICALTLKNGFVVVGDSACADPANFNESLGKDLAYTRAFDQLWKLEGYLLKQRMFEATPVATEQVPIQTQVSFNVMKNCHQFAVKWKGNPDWQEISRAEAIALRKKYPWAFSEFSTADALE